VDASSFAFAGTAVSNVDYYITNLPVTLDPGVVDVTFPFIYPTKASSAVGSLSIVSTLLAGSGYAVTNNTALTTLTLEALPPGTSLFSDNFESDPSGNNWKVAFQSYTNGSSDYNLVFGYDYTSGSIGNLSPIPPAPHSLTNDTKGVYMTVNKGAGVSAGINLYLKNHTFSGNYALRFDMFLVENSAGTAQSKAEEALFGINHDGSHTNWIRNAVTGTSLPGSPTESDGIFFDIGADGNGTGGAFNDFALWSGPTWTNGVGVIGPTNILSLNATATTQIFKRPPYDSGTAAGGDPANTVINPTPTWTEVEVSQVQSARGNLITWKMNNNVILSYYNTNSALMASTYTNGTVMLGYCDPWDDLGNSTPGSGEAAVIYDNVRVVQLSVPVIAVQPTNAIANVGSSATFTVGATTATTITNYQWCANGTAIAGATNSTLTVNPLTTASFSTAYAVLVTDGAYSVWSSNATVVAASGPMIITPPVDQTAALGGSASFSVTASTFTGITNYQWMFQGTNLSNATKRTLALTNLQQASFGGPYTVSVSDGFTSITSSPAMLILANPPGAPTLTAPTRSGDNFSFSFSTEVGPAYVLDYKSSLTNAVWIPVSTNVGTGGVITVTNTSSAPEGYYRIRLQ